MAPETAESPDVPDYTSDYDRSEVADNLQDAMSEAFYNATEGRVRDAENERVRVKWLRAAVASATEYRQQLDALEAEEREQRIARLEKQLDDLMDSQ